VGSFIVYVDGKPVLVDPGVGEYTGKTFSNERYNIWTMQSIYHNLLPSFDNILQLPGEEYKAKNVKYEKEKNILKLSMDISSTYPSEANVKEWKREVKFIRGDGVEIKDKYLLKKTVKEITLSLITPSTPYVKKKQNEILFKSRIMNSQRKSGCAILKWAGDFDVFKGKIVFKDEKLKKSWGDYLTRVLFIIKSPELSGEIKFTIFSNRGG